MIELLPEPMDSHIDIPAFLKSKCCLEHIPSGKSTSKQFSEMKLQLVITSGTPFPSHDSILYDPLSMKRIPLAKTPGM